MLLLLGIEQGDGLEQVNHLASKVSKIRLWPDLKDSKKQWASSVVENGFELMVATWLEAVVVAPPVPGHAERGPELPASLLSHAFCEVSQFTLFATFKKPKPDFHQAMGGSEAEGLYEAFVEKCRSELAPGKVSTGSFGAMMQVELCNDGPVTVELLSPVAPSTAPSAAASAAASAAPSVAPSASPTARSQRAGSEQFEELLGQQPYLGGRLASLASHSKTG